MGVQRFARRLGTAEFLLLLLALVGFTAVYRNSPYYSLSNPARCHSISIEGRTGDVSVSDHAVPTAIVPVHPPALLAPRRGHAELASALIQTIALVVSPQRRPPPLAS